MVITMSMHVGSPEIDWDCPSYVHSNLCTSYVKVCLNLTRLNVKHFQMFDRSSSSKWKQNFAIIFPQRKQKCINLWTCYLSKIDVVNLFHPVEALWRRQALHLLWDEDNSKWSAFLTKYIFQAHGQRPVDLGGGGKAWAGVSSLWFWILTSAISLQQISFVHVF